MSDELSPRQVAEELGVTVRTVQRWIADGRLRVRRVGSRVRVSRSSLSAVTDATPAATPARTIRRLLVANRGEIASRIARTARSLGIHTTGLRGLGERPAADLDVSVEIASFLDGDAILAIARRHAADALHPGYGFLAENAGFAQAVTDAGLAWIGPPPEAIAAMGDKAAARRTAAGLGVATVPGYDGDDQADATFVAEAMRIGVPVLVKPSAGGGGKGMRIVRDEAALRDELAAARREASRSFGDDRLILERLVEHARHVEIQVLFDARGGGIHLGERDCSAQRRSQKIVEEAPGPSMTRELRRAMGEAAVRIGTAVDYVGAGTVEMLLTDAGDFYFLEMNTRLQVEHAVTEAVTGRDLVADQIRIAEGASLADLGLRGPVEPRGHAIEARIYAEDPEAGFLPATGTAVVVRWPDGLRVDAGIAEGDVVADRYDPMLAKVIAHGGTRAEALDRLRVSLEQTTVLGVRTNVRFLRWLLRQEAMRSGDVRTDTIAALELPSPPVPADRHWREAAELLRAGTGDAWSGGWRMNADAVVRVAGDAETRTIALPRARRDEGVTAVRHGEVVHVDVEGQSDAFRLAPPPNVSEAVRHAAAAGADAISDLVAPMPGRVVAVRVTPGTSVRAHETIIVIEAMKMEHAVTAPTDATVERIVVGIGQQVARGERLAELGRYHDADA
jgi:excisionase family DNA binding protein